MPGVEWHGCGDASDALLPGPVDFGGSSSMGKGSGGTVTESPPVAPADVLAARGAADDDAVALVFRPIADKIPGRSRRTQRQGVSGGGLTAKERGERLSILPLRQRIKYPSGPWELSPN